MIKGKETQRFSAEAHSSGPFDSLQMWQHCNPIGIQSLYPQICLLEATIRREAALERQTSPSQQPTALLTLEGMTSYRRIEEAFHCKLKGPVVVDKKTLVELQNFQTVRLNSFFVFSMILKMFCYYASHFVSDPPFFFFFFSCILKWQGFHCHSETHTGNWARKKRKKLTFSIPHMTFWAAYKRHSVFDLE